MLVVQNPNANAGDRRKEGWIPDPWLGKIPWSREWLNSQVYLTGECHRQETVHRVIKSQT